MSKDLRREAKRLFPLVRDILNRDWNPIGVSGLPEDEYDSYALRIVGMLMRRDARSVVETYLRETAAGWIGCPVSDSVVRKTADALFALDL